MRSWFRSDRGLPELLSHLSRQAAVLQRRGNRGLGPQLRVCADHRTLTVSRGRADPDQTRGWRRTAVHTCRGEREPSARAAEALIESSVPLCSAVGVCRPKPAIETAAPAGYGAFGAGRSTAFTAGPLRSSGSESASTATSPGDS